MNSRLTCADVADVADVVVVVAVVVVVGGGGVGGAASMPSSSWWWLLAEEEAAEVPLVREVVAESEVMARAGALLVEFAAPPRPRPRRADCLVAIFLRLVTRVRECEIEEININRPQRFE